MANKMMLLGSAILAWGGVAGLCSIALANTRFVMPLAVAAIGAASGGLVLSIIGAAQYERY